jgi:hypothetical protein
MTSNAAIRSVAGLLAAVLAWVSSAMPAVAQHQHGHEHQSGAAAVASIRLDSGRKWATDASLRSGMAAIRAAFDADHPAIHDGKQTDAQYEALAGRIESQVNFIVANCRLPPEADANLHYLVADLSQGVSLMRGQDPARTRHDGAALVHGALLAYGKYFDDPDWPTDPSAGH